MSHHAAYSTTLPARSLPRCSGFWQARRPPFSIRGACGRELPALARMRPALWRIHRSWSLKLFRLFASMTPEEEKTCSSLHLPVVCGRFHRQSTFAAGRSTFPESLKRPKGGKRDLEAIALVVPAEGIRQVTS